MENKTENKFSKIGTDEHFFKDICGDSLAYQDWKKQITYEYKKTGHLDFYDVESESWTHPNKQKLGTVSDMLGSHTYFNNDAKLDLVSLDVQRRWLAPGKTWAVVFMTNKALRWFKANKKRVKCTGFQNNAPVFSFPVAGSDKSFEILSDDSTAKAYWLFIFPDDNTMTFIRYYRKSGAECIHGDDYGDVCYDAVLYRFDRTGNLHPDRLVKGKPQAINGIIHYDY